ncbi:UNVERIFIED_CONTAM: HMG1/2-like protein [Sesamum calycinum]|uniref:Vacuolar ATPase assembly protein VMA22 n=1 Tax=Sesamum calycinum TaxID=2727403 RepID=A0AAW2QML5_9LAMI
MQGSENGVESRTEVSESEQYILNFLDSVDSYLILMDSLSSALRQGWLDLASARHSMGASRVNSALFDLKSHHASTTVEVNDDLPHFKLCKWASSDDPEKYSEEGKFEEDELLQNKSDSPRHRHQELQEKRTEGGTSPVGTDNQAQKERFKKLSMFGTLVSPKLRATQLSFETAPRAAYGIKPRFSLPGEELRPRVLKESYLEKLSTKGSLESMLYLGELPALEIGVPGTESSKCFVMKGGKSKADSRKADGRLAVKKQSKKEKKAAKDPNKPKRPPSAFFVFMEDFRKQYKEKHPNNKSVAAVGKAGGDKWKSFSDEAGGGDDESDKSKSEVNDEDDEEGSGEEEEDDD